MSTSTQKRKRTDVPRRTKKQKRAAAYHSSSSEDEQDADDAIQLPNLSGTSSLPAQDAPETSASEADSNGSEQELELESAEQSSASDDEDENDNEVESNPTRTSKKPRKRNDPTAFATSISAILSSKLSRSKQSDPLLSRSATAASNAKELADERLEAKAKRKIKEEKRKAAEKGRVTDVLGIDDDAVKDGEAGGLMAGEIAEEEKRLKKTAQRGVIKLFNAVRAAQVKAEEVEASKGIVGAKKREEKVTEMSKKGFLELINGQTAVEA